MIERTVFAQCMAAVAQRIGKPLGDEALAMYFAILSEELTTAQFQAGMKGIFRDHAFATWPSPSEIIRRAKPAGELRALKAWSAIEDVLRRRVAEKPLVPQMETCGVDALAIATFLAIGGLSRWRALNDWRFDAMRTEFLERFAEAERLPEGERQQLITANARSNEIGAVQRGRVGAAPLHELLPSQVPR